MGAKRTQACEASLSSHWECREERTLNMRKGTNKPTFEDVNLLSVCKGNGATNKLSCSTISLCRVGNMALKTRIVIFILLLLAVGTHGNASSNCDPSRSDSCEFGATCKQVRGQNHFAHSLEDPVFRCQCPKINCYRAALKEVVCGHNGKYPKPYFNILCLMLEECETQRPIKAVCSGSCRSSSCKSAQSQIQHGQCPPRNYNLCLNGGLCVHHKSSNESFCRCSSDFTGERCEQRVIAVLHTESENKQECSRTQTILSIFAIVLLSVVLLAVITCFCCRKSSRDEDKESKLWPSTSVEHGETTPLRESTRSEYVFPTRSRLAGGSSD